MHIVFSKNIVRQTAGLLLFCLSALFTSRADAGRFDSLFHQSYPVRALYYDRVIAPALSSLSQEEVYKELDRLEERAVAEGDEGARLEVVWGRYEYDDGNSRTPVDDKLTKYEALLRSLDIDRYPEYAAIIMTNLGQNYYGKKHNYTAAFEQFINAYNITSRLSSAAFPDKKLMLVWIGNRYYMLGDFEKSKHILLEADSLSHVLYKASAYNNKNTLGLIYRSTGSYDTAIRYFRSANALANQAGDSVWAAITAGNIGICYYMQGDYTQAVPLLQQDIRYCFRPSSFAADNGMNSLMILADIHLRQDRVTEVGEDIRIAWKYLDSCRDIVKPMSMLYDIMARYEARMGRYQQAYRFQDSANVYRDSISKRDNIYQLAKVSHRKDLEHAEEQVKRLRSEKQLLSITRNGLVVFVVLLCTIAVLIINRMRLKHRLRQAGIRMEKDQAERQLQTATLQLAQFTRYLQEKNTLIERSGQEIEKLQSQLDSTHTEIVNNDVLQQLYHSTILTDDEWAEFKLLFEQVHKGFLQRLREKMPDLTPADTRFMVLSKLHLSNKEMAGILGVRPDTIRSNKHRLKKRFGLSEDDALKAVIDTI